MMPRFICMNSVAVMKYTRTKK